MIGGKREHAARHAGQMNAARTSMLQMWKRKSVEQPSRVLDFGYSSVNPTGRLDRYVSTATMVNGVRVREAFSVIQIL